MDKIYKKSIDKSTYSWYNDIVDIVSIAVTCCWHMLMLLKKRHFMIYNVQQNARKTEMVKKHFIVFQYRKERACMKKNKLSALFMAAVMAVGIMPVSYAADTAAEDAKYAYFMDTSDDSAYVWMGETIEGDGLGFIDGQKSNITDANDPIYNETVNLDGLDARKQYQANTFYFTVDESEYTAEDNEFVFSIVFYDFGPAEGKFQFEYHTTAGGVKQIQLTKPGTKPGWYVKTVSVNDADLSKTYDNGATVRVINGAYNAFKKVEMVNVSKLKREGKELSMTALGLEARLDLEELQIIKANDTRFTDANLSKKTNAYDAESLLNTITGSSAKANSANKKVTMTQGELLDMYLTALGVTKADGESSVDAAKNSGVIDAMDMFISDDAAATNYNLGSIVDSALRYKSGGSYVLMEALITNGFYGEKTPDDIDNEFFKTVYDAMHTDTSSLDWLMSISEGSSYVLLGETIEENGVHWMDGQAMGITNSSDKYWNETVTLDGIVARKQYQANGMYFSVDDSFYGPEDKEFLISIVYYDFGPSEGRYYLEYHSKSGTIEERELIKPGTNPGWAVKTVVLDDIDLSKTYEDGTTFRIRNGAYNAFKKVEVVNLSKLRREGKNLPMTALSLFEVRREMASIWMIDGEADPIFADSNAANECTLYDVYSMRNKLTYNTSELSESLKNQTLTQGELLDTFMPLVGLQKNDGESSVEAAARHGIAGTGFFTIDSAPATYFNLLHLAYQTLLYTGPTNKTSLLEQLIVNGFYAGIDPGKVSNGEFASLWFKNPRTIPYETITDPATGRKYHWMSIEGAHTLRGYNNVIGWTPDGTGFVCGLTSGDFFLYDIPSQKLTPLDQTIGSSGHIPVYANVDGWAYYPKREYGVESIWRVNLKTFKKEKLMDLPDGIKANYFEVSNDGRYLALESSGIGKDPEGRYAVTRVDLQEKKVDYQWYAFSYSNILNHNQVNPVYTNLVGFSHETDTSKWNYDDIIDRANVIDIETGEVIKYNQGIKGDGGGRQLVTHEVWSYDGEYRYFCSWAADTVGEYEIMPAFVRTAPDYTHRQYFRIDAPNGGANHGNVSGDNKWALTDEGWMILINLDTHQCFPIVNVRNVIGMKNHPYHPHAHISYTGNMANWGHEHRGVLGVAWIDFNDIAENEVAKGDRYPYNDTVTRVSYEGLECESNIVTAHGRECITAGPGSGIYFDSLVEEADDNNVAVKITFDYYDNNEYPIVLTYTKGVEERNDALQVSNKNTQISRTGTNKWKTAEIVLDSANFEDINKFTTDFFIKSGGANIFISDVKVEFLRNNGSEW